ncbi:MAG: tetratricopeptide repeat protein [Gammaproteobacteria bacterium]
MTVIDFPARQKGNALDKAQDKVNDAWDANTVKDRVRLAKEALEISPLCADALVILAKHSRTANAALKHYKKAVKAAEEALGDQFEELKGAFWGFMETRPYMRARAGLAETLRELEQTEEAAAHYAAMLELNPNDNQGIRYLLATCLLETQQHDDLRKLLDQYPDDCDAIWGYTRLLLEYRTSGASPGLDQYLESALEANEHIPAFLANPTLLPKELPPFMTMGGEDQAAIYVSENANTWAETDGAVEWLTSAVAAKKTKA